MTEIKKFRAAMEEAKPLQLYVPYPKYFDPNWIWLLRLLEELVDRVEAKS